MKRIEARADGAHLEIEDLDLDAGTKTVTRTADHPDGADVQTGITVDPDELERRRAADREDRQVARMVSKLTEIQTGLANLRAMSPLTNTDYPPGPEREMARQVKELRQLSIDLCVANLAIIRIMRGIAAEDD